MNHKMILTRIINRTALPNPMTFYSRYFLMLDKPTSGSGWVNVCCCFHKDKRPSLSINLISGGFYCFSCGAKGGDVIAFHMRVRDVPFSQAVTELGAWMYV